MLLIEVKSVSGKWIKFRSGSRQGKQIAFENFGEYQKFLNSINCKNGLHYRVKES